MFSLPISPINKNGLIDIFETLAQFPNTIMQIKSGDYTVDAHSLIGVFSLESTNRSSCCWLRNRMRNSRTRSPGLRPLSPDNDHTASKIKGLAQNALRRLSQPFYRGARCLEGSRRRFCLG
ncbi:MAG: hypothetical protein IIU42_05650 [Ruminococcus sp.]|nr:hypothetical protein [Ruminococcus sp.]